MTEIIFGHYSIYHLIVFIFDGLFVGFIGGLFSIGGGTAVVPVLVAALHYSPKLAVGVSVTQMMFSAFFNSFLNYRKGKLNLKQALVPCLGGLIGGASVGPIMKIASDLAVAYLVCIMLIWALFKMFITPAAPTQPESQNKTLYFFIGLIVGSIATSAGIGGAVLLTPALMSFCHLGLKKAAAIAGMFVAFSATGGFVSLLFNNFVLGENHLDIPAGIIIGIFSIPGVWLGNWCFQHTTDRMQKILTIIFYIAMLSLAVLEIFKQKGSL